MEVKEWTYEEIPEYVNTVPEAKMIASDGNEIGVIYRKDVVYAEVDGVELHLQINIPFSRNNPEMVCPAVVWVQGSAWFEQDVYAKVPKLGRLASLGYVTATVQYRHSGIASFPAQIIDARNAVRFLRKHAAEYHIDPDKIILGGDSSGGHTAVYAGIYHDDAESSNLYPGISGEVKGIIDYYGSVSVMAPDSNPIQILHCLPDSPEGRVMGGVNLLEHPELQRKLSIECNITPETEIAPLLIVHGTKDRLVNAEGSAILFNKLKECGKEAELYFIQGADHGGPEFWTPGMLQIADAFIKRCLA